MVLTLNAGPTVMDDTDSYHIQMVKWIQEFGSVPGIANLHLRFGLIHPGYLDWIVILSAAWQEHLSRSEWRARFLVLLLYT